MIRSILSSELRRFRAPLGAAIAAHTLALGALAYADELFRPTAPRLVAAAFAYALAGLLFGVYQIASFRRGELWQFLLHRPLAPRRIFLALAGAAALLLALAIALPLALAAAFGSLSGTGASLWKFLVAPYAWGVALGFYFAGCLVVLRPWRGAFLAAAPVVILVVPTAMGAWVFVPLALVLVWLGILAAAALRPDLSSPPPGRLAIAVALLPALHVLFLALSFALLFAYSVGVAIREQGWRGPASFGWNDYFAAGSHEHSGYLAPRDALLHGLRLGSPPARRFDSEVAATEVTELVPTRSLAFDERGRTTAVRSPALDLVLDAGEGKLRLFAPRAAVGATEAAKPFALVPIGGEVENLDRALVAPVRDGTLVSFLFGARSERDFGEARQVVWLVAADGRRELVVDAPLAQGLPVWVRHRGFLISPALQTVDDLVRSSLYGVGPRSARFAELLSQSPPQPIVAGALLVALLSAAATWALGRRRGLGTASRRVWTVVALLLGLPVPFALPLFTSRRS